MKYNLQLLLLISSASQAAAVHCGSKYGSCPAGQCCSEGGYCGTTTDYCQSPQCQLVYSDSCDNYKRPIGASTINVPRPRIGSVPYGTIINDCTVPGTVALTFDDGPYIYTSQLLDILDSFNVKATFFVAGNNLGKGQMDDPSLPWPAIMRRIYSSGHQIASHSWSHQDFGLVNSTIQLTEILYNEMAFRNLFGWFPTYWRPPYLNCEDVPGCQTILNSMGYHIIDIDIDTKDYMYDDPTLIQTSKDRFSSAVSTDSAHNSYIELSHDIHYQTVVNLTAFMINTIRQLGYRPVTVGECLGDPPDNWYRDASGTSGGISTSSSNIPFPSTSSIVSLPQKSSSVSSQPTSNSVTLPATTLRTSAVASTSSTSLTTLPSALVVSPNQRCGGTTGYTCQGSKAGNCCSFYGYCGSTSDFCGTGCQTPFGTCSQGQGGVVTTSNGLCGAKYQATCVGYSTKQCCSSSGYCGNTTAYCGTGCQSAFGICG